MIRARRGDASGKAILHVLRISLITSGVTPTTPTSKLDVNIGLPVGAVKRFARKNTGNQTFLYYPPDSPKKP
jgi:hypothetical protein